MAKLASPQRIPQRQVLADSVYEALLERLFDNSVLPDTPLNIDQLARDFEVSQTPVREALARLESTSLVVRTALRGYRVAPPLSPKEIADLMDARCVLESELAKRAVVHATDDLIDQLRATIERLASTPMGTTFSEYRAYWEADELFHELIARAADNSFLYKALTSLGAQAQRFRQLAGLGVNDSESAISEHRAILKAFEKGDDLLVHQAMTEHLVNVRERAIHDAIGRLEPSLESDLS